MVSYTNCTAHVCGLFIVTMGKLIQKCIPVLFVVFYSILMYAMCFHSTGYIDLMYTTIILFLVRVSVICSM